MKLSYSTLGCPNWNLDTIIQKAVEYGYDGIEIRGLLQELDVTTLPEFTTQAKDTLKKFNNAGIEVCCFSSSIFMSTCNQKKETTYLEELKRYADLCEVFETPYIRIFGGEIGDLSWDEAIDKAAVTIEKMIDAIKDYKVKIVIETHDDWMSCNHFKALMEKVNSDKVGILWDVNHPFMFIGEYPVETWQKVGKWIYHTHWKDSKIAIDTVMGFEPCLMGEGDLPHQQIYEVLKKGGYNRYLSLEWEKRWHPELPDPEIAFPQYIKYMRGIDT